jgi:hypothetical protein
MGEYEPDDSRTVTQSPHQAPGEPPRTGPREGEARERAVTDDGEKNEKRGKPTARDAAGNKQPGYAEKGEAEADEDSVPLGK